MHETITIFCTCPDEDTAARLARALVEQSLAACVNIVPVVRSIYAWEGKVEDQREALMLIKTSADHFFLIEHWMGEHHPYDVPELLAVRNEHVSEEYLKWLWQTVST